MIALFFFFQAEDGIRDLVRSRGLGDVYKRQSITKPAAASLPRPVAEGLAELGHLGRRDGHAITPVSYTHLRAHETVLDLVCRLLLEKNTDQNTTTVCV